MFGFSKFRTLTDKDVFDVRALWDPHWLVQRRSRENSQCVSADSICLRLGANHVRSGLQLTP